MTDAAPLPAFEHDPLPDSTTHLRLLHITHGDFERHVECEVSTWPIETSPLYYAISYTWGDPAATAEITLNGRPFVVRQNCEYVLQQAFASKASWYFWVDTLCIDQSRIQERGHQVGIMGQIYSGAQHVFACVGPHADDSEYLQHICERYNSMFDDISSSIRLSTIAYGTLSTRCDLNNPIRERTWLGVLYLLLMGASKRLKLYQAFVSFMRRPYFTRVWVLQELFLAEQISYCCGTTVQLVTDLLALNTLFEFWMEDYTFTTWTRRLGEAL
jgi:hypothetical protein